MIPPRAALLVVLLGASLGATSPVAAAPAGADPSAGAAAQKPPLLAVLVAKAFLRSFVEKDLAGAARLCAPKMSFDGRTVKGERAVRGELQRLMTRLGNGRRLRKVVVLTLAEAVRRFGPPPARLGLGQRRDVIVGFGRLRRLGIVVFLAQDGAGAQTRWRVIALSD